jgi:cytochrome c oxidase subunit II
MKIRTILTLVMIAIVLAVISLWMGQQAYAWFPPQASAEAQLIDRLFSFLVTLGTFIFLGVVGTLTYAILFQQVGKYDFSDGPHIEGNVPLEVIWTAIPFVLSMRTKLLRSPKNPQLQPAQLICRRNHPLH